MAKDTKKRGKMSTKDSWKPDKTVIKSLRLMVSVKAAKYPPSISKTAR